MLITCLALIPGALAQSYFFGYGVLINLCLCITYAISAEALVLLLRKRKIKQVVSDNSALLTGVLLGLALPQTLPFWMSFIGVWFAIIIAKQLYGGLGLNPFNPAMTGYILLLISFPVEMTAWLPARTIASHFPDFTETLQLIFFEKTAEGMTIEYFRLITDGFTMATPLDYIKTEFTQSKMRSEILSNQYLTDNIYAWTVINSCYLLGGIFLLLRKIIRPHIPLSVLSSLFITSFILYQFDSEATNAPLFHLFSGATMLGVWFIATDPVTAATTPRGRIIYGLCIGFLVIIIRTYGGYPDAIAFSILLLNLAAPTLDHYTRPVIYGHQKEEQANE